MWESDPLWIGCLWYQSSLHFDRVTYQKDPPYISPHKQIHWRFPRHHWCLRYCPLPWSQSWSLHHCVLPLPVCYDVWWYRSWCSLVPHCPVSLPQRKEISLQQWRGKNKLTQNAWCMLTRCRSSKCSLVVVIWCWWWVSSPSLLVPSTTISSPCH